MNNNIFFYVGEFLVNTLQGSSSARLRNKTSESKEIEALERSKSFPVSHLN